jgi:hypothetical protein
MPEKEMSRQMLRVFAFAWIAGAVLLRLYASKGGDASIVGGLLFLAWTAPFGPIWQFWISELIPRSWEPSVMQVIGDVFAILAGATFWFFIFPSFVRSLRSKTRRPDAS